MLVYRSYKEVERQVDEELQSSLVKSCIATLPPKVDRNVFLYEGHVNMGESFKTVNTVHSLYEQHSYQTWNSACP